ncbi:hypothetical protein PQX77_013369 [Marasmius sp. AFHP31]|nr:hypothetical protein PQX77_013369 [Marasmius sp. AFHP31]
MIIQLGAYCATLWVTYTSIVYSHPETTQNARVTSRISAARLIGTPTDDRTKSETNAEADAKE